MLQSTMLPAVALKFKEMGIFMKNVNLLTLIKNCSSHKYVSFLPEAKLLQRISSWLRRMYTRKLVPAVERQEVLTKYKP